jgi:hypothetical protein
MSRVNEPCQTQSVYLPEPTHGDPPARRQKTATEGSPHQRSRQHLEKLGGKHKADTAAVTAKLGDMRVKAGIHAVTDVAAKLVGHVTTEILIHAAPNLVSVAGTAAAGAGVVVSGAAGPVWMLLSGLSELGRINHEVQVVSEKSARIRGFAETLGKALDEPAASAAELQAAAGAARYPSHYAGLASARLPSVPARQLEDFRKLAAAYAEGAGEAVALVRTLSTDDRRQLAEALASEIGSCATTSADRLVGWFHLPR